MKSTLQTESSECGLACLSMIASHYGHQTDLADLRRQFSISLKGATLDQLMRHAACGCHAPRDTTFALRIG